MLRRALQSQDFREPDWAPAIAELTPLLAATLNARLPLQGRTLRLCDLAREDRVAELEFHFTLADTDGAALLALLHEHGIAPDRRDFGAWPRLKGLMTGKIDLTFRADGRVYVVDYKSNRLPAYDAGTLAQAMARSEYDLQALLYAVAVHRWLRGRLGAQYDFERHFGGALYLFARGLAADPAQGVVQPLLSRALVEGVDALFAQAVQG